MSAGQYHGRSVFTPHPAVVREAQRIATSDGYVLGGALYHVPAQQTVDHAVLFSTGGGIKGEIYRYFAMYLAGAGVPTLVYDYRGIGWSRRGSLRGLRATFEDWSEYDCAAAASHLQRRFAGAQITCVAHSAGGMIALGAPTDGIFKQYVFIAPTTGFLGDFAMPWKPLLWIYNRHLMMWTARAIGYFPQGRFGIDEDLPYGVAVQRATRTTPDVEDSSEQWDLERLRKIKRNAKQARGPAMVLSASDDPWATEDAVKRFIFMAPQLAPIRRKLVPDELGVPKLAHMGFFRRRYCALLWPMALAFVVSSPLPAAVM